MKKSEADDKKNENETEKPSEPEETVEPGADKNLNPTEPATTITASEETKEDVGQANIEVAVVKEEEKVEEEKVEVSEEVQMEEAAPIAEAVEQAGVVTNAIEERDVAAAAAAAVAVAVVQMGEEMDTENVNEEEIKREEDENGDDRKNGSGTGSNAAKHRRFFPRVRLLVTPDWEHFLQGLLHSIQAHRAQFCQKASHNSENAWYQVFHAVYGGVAAPSCSVPSGKNRYHKFKDKMIELWKHMEQTQPHTDVPADEDADQVMHRRRELWKLAHEQWSVYQMGAVGSGKNLTTDKKASGGDGNGAISNIGSPKKKMDTNVNRKRPATSKMVEPPSIRARLASDFSKGETGYLSDSAALPSRLIDLHGLWKMSLDYGKDRSKDCSEELDVMKSFYHKEVRSFLEWCSKTLLGDEDDDNTSLRDGLKNLQSLRTLDPQDETLEQMLTETYRKVLKKYMNTFMEVEEMKEDPVAAEPEGSIPVPVAEGTSEPLDPPAAESAVDPAGDTAPVLPSTKEQEDEEIKAKATKIDAV